MILIPEHTGRRSLQKTARYRGSAESLLRTESGIDLGRVRGHCRYVRTEQLVCDNLCFARRRTKRSAGVQMGWEAGGSTDAFIC